MFVVSVNVKRDSLPAIVGTGIIAIIIEGSSRP